ncbi:helix-turn-helix transcriptional regulator [Mesorhizobium sp. GR13]|uniref:helix-turn-helix domain-containing protein n=1 Tax=Mesorhizobium sp. GR13 TaxID=2562308 RepID=UPI0010C0ECAD|nr:helix-turn-helix transcriptional regulator [Mesorhizobium sp. GR13]
MEVRARIGWNVRRLRVERELSQDDLAYNAGIERAYVGHLERGTKNPTLDTLEKLSKALGTDIADLFIKPPEGAELLRPLKPGRKIS